MSTNEAAHWAALQEHFHHAIELAPDQRAGYLAAMRGTNPELAGEVQSLIRAHERSGLIGSLGAPASLEPRPFGLESGTFGPYRILRPLGHGGMGAVYLAERTCPDFLQLVAIKLLRGDFSAPRLLERFKIERRILARLEHPGIARLIDAGSTPRGNPYFAMEYVEGVNLTAYCAQANLEVEQKLRLFLDICDAVAYAHQRLVVHCDLKPRNILVAEDGRVKLLDFGIALMLEEDEDAPRITTGSARWFTPDYAAPEQVCGQGASTLTDVYALGAVLYEMLTGSTPLPMDRRCTLKEVEDAVCNRMPPRASSRVAAGPLRRQLAGDLDVMLLKALAKAPERRYASVRQMADDIRRHLDHQPVLARPDRVGYRAARFVRRHRTSAIAATLGLAGLVTGLIVVTQQAADARRARVNAESALQESQAVTGFLAGLFDATAPTGEGGDAAAAGEVLRRGRARVDALASQPLAQARMLDALGMVAGSLGQYEEAHQMLTRALAARRRLLGPDHPDVVQSLRHVGESFRRMSRMREAEATYQEALAVSLRTRPPDELVLADVYADLGYLMPYLGRVQESERYYQQALQLKRARLGAASPEVEDAEVMLSGALRRTGDLAGAMAQVRQAIATRSARVGPDDPSLADLVVVLGDLEFDAGDTAAAEQGYRGSLTIYRRTLGPDHLDQLHAIESLADLLSATGHHAEAIELAREGVRIRQRALGSRHPLVLESTMSLARILVLAGQWPEAERLARRTLAGLRAQLGPDHTVIGQNLILLSTIARDRGRLEESEQLGRDAVAMLVRLHGAHHGLVARGRIELARTLMLRGNLGGAQSELQQALAALDGAGNEASAIEAHDALAMVYQRGAHPREAAAERAQSASLRRRAVGGTAAPRS